VKAIAFVLVFLVPLSVATSTPARLDPPAHEVPAGVVLEHVRRGGVEHLHGGETLRRYTFEPAAQPRLCLTPAQPWPGAGELRVRVQNAMPWAVTLVVDIEGTDGAHLHASLGLPAGPPQTMVVPLHATSPRDFGMQAGPPMPFGQAGQRVVLATEVEGAQSLAAVRAVQLSIPAPQAEQVLLIGTPVTVADDALHDAYAGIVDRYGQYTRGRLAA
jgi:hypothetical protein